MPLEAATLERTDGDQEYLWTLNFGPQHPATHTTLRLILTMDGETIQAKLRRADEKSFLLTSRGFHWINEYPFNR